MRLIWDNQFFSNIEITNSNEPKTNATPNPNLYILIDGIFFRYLFYLIISNEIEFNK